MSLWVESPSVSRRSEANTPQIPTVRCIEMPRALRRSRGSRLVGLNFGLLLSGGVASWEGGCRRIGGGPPRCPGRFDGAPPAAPAREIPSVQGPGRRVPPSSCPRFPGRGCAGGCVQRDLPSLRAEPLRWALPARDACDASREKGCVPWTVLLRVICMTPLRRDNDPPGHRQFVTRRRGLPCAGVPLGTYVHGVHRPWYNRFPRSAARSERCAPAASLPESRCGGRDRKAVTKERSDEMHSFCLSETLKYFFLLFAPPETLDFRKVVFTTEAHPIRRWPGVGRSDPGP